MKKIIFGITMIMISFMIFSTPLLATEENRVPSEESANQETSQLSNETTQETIQPEPPKETPPTKVTKNEVMYVQERCNIRASYSASSERVGGLEVGTEVTVIEEYSNGWYKIQYDGGEAFIKAGILRTTKPEIEQPEPEPEEPDTEPEQTTENRANTEDEMEELVNQIGVLPEVGRNIADVLTIVVMLLAIGMVIYEKNKVE